MQLPLEVTLDASESSDVEGIVSLRWDCEGDGKFEATSDWTVANARTHVCTYTEDGAFEATVQATNSLVRTLCIYQVLRTLALLFYRAILLPVHFLFVSVLHSKPLVSAVDMEHTQQTTVPVSVSSVSVSADSSPTM